MSEPRTEAGKRLLPILDAAEAAWVKGDLPVDILNLTQPVRHAIRAIEDAARADALRDAAAAVEGLPVSRHVLGLPEGRRWVRLTAALAAIRALGERP